MDILKYIYGHVCDNQLKPVPKYDLMVTGNYELNKLRNFMKANEKKYSIPRAHRGFKAVSLYLTNNRVDKKLYGIYGYATILILNWIFEGRYEYVNGKHVRNRNNSFSINKIVLTTNLTIKNIVNIVEILVRDEHFVDYIMSPLKN